MAESDNIPTKLQDLLVYLIPQLNKFPRDQKFVLGVVVNGQNTVTNPISGTQQFFRLSQ
jgi:hypothetical protein